MNLKKGTEIFATVAGAERYCGSRGVADVYSAIKILNNEWRIFKKGKASNNFAFTKKEAQKMLNEWAKENKS